MTASRAAWPCVFLSLAGCYFQYPHDLKRNPPARAGNAQIELHDHEEHYDEPCKKNLEGCFVRHGELVREIEYTRTSATYDGKPITRGQVSSLAEPARQAKAYAEMEKHLSTCKLSLIPSAVFAAGAAADLAGFVVYDATQSDSVKNVGLYMLLGGVVAMAVGAALSYPIGGYACNRGRDAAYDGQIMNDDSEAWNTVPSRNADAKLERERELRAAVASFNAGAGEAPHEDTAAAEPAPAPAAAPKAVAGNVHDALAAAGKFSTFLRLAEYAGLDELASSEHLVVFAPTDAVFASAPNFDLDKLLRGKTKAQRHKLNVEMQRYFTDDGSSLDELVTRGKVSSSGLRVRRKGSVVLVDDYPVVDQPLAASNGTIYPLGPK
ncbi:MAG TPA: fasciclin domain-containing protein [Kofleriaceae bacterium]